MDPSRPDLDPLFSPESIAIVGASPDSRYAAALVGSLERGYDGPIYPVNPGRDEVWGRTCYDSITAVPEVVDLVVVNVPREHAVGVVRDAGELGVPAALVITAGFAEADDEGADLEAQLADAATEYGIALCGPNGIGLSNVHDRVFLDASPGGRDPEPGSIGLVSQSGALAFVTFFERGADEDIRFAYVVSSGNEAVLTTADYVEYMAGDDRVDVICAYVEGIDDPERFMRVTDAAAREGTPVLAIKVGRSEPAETATVSHTGSLAGDDAAWDAAFRQAGVERVPDIPDLLSRASAHAAYEPPDSNRVCIASTSGGLAGLLADLADERDLALPDLSPGTETALLGMDDLLTFGELHNPVDIRGYGASVLPEIADALLADEAFDAYVFAIGLPAVDDRAAGIADDAIEIARRASDPVFFLWTGRKEPMDLPDPQPYERLRAEVPLFSDPGRCLDALASLVHAEGWRDRHADRPSRAELLGRIDPGGPADLGLPGGQVLAWADAERLLDAYGIDAVETRLATDADEAAAAAAAFDGPVVLKIDSPDVPHRTDADAVAVGLSTEEGVREAYAEIVANAREHAPDPEIKGVLVQPQVGDGVEALVGVSRAEGFGPVVTVAPGGTLAEVIDDGAIRIPPFSPDDATEAIEETALGELLAAPRGGSSADADALADLLERVGRLAAEVNAVAELDLNPVIVREDGAAVVDVLVRTR